MTEIYLITDYKNNFGSKWKAQPYRSGYDKDVLKELFALKGYKIIIMSAFEVKFEKKIWENSWVIYTSLEEKGLHYKNFLFDVLKGIENLGGKLIPSLDFLQAHENKVFMEILRETKLPEKYKTLNSQLFGTLEDLKNALQKNQIKFPCVIKKSSGSMSRNVALAKNENELTAAAKKMSSTFNFKSKLKEIVRTKKYVGYQPESSFQNKFIIQPFVENLTCDWKVLIYANQIYTLKRNIKENDFKASGSGLNYTAGSESGFPIEYLDFVYEFFKLLSVPNLSVDFSLINNQPYIFEFQAISFGTSTQYKSKDFYEKTNELWELKKNKWSQEEVYVESIVSFIQQIN